MLRNLLLSCAVVVVSAPAWASGCEIGKVAELPMTLWHGHIRVPIGIDGVQGNFLLDTGAAVSMLDADFAARAGVQWDRNQPDVIVEGVGGHQTLALRAGRIRSMSLGGLTITDREMPMGTLGSSQPGGGFSDGLLGADMLNLLDLELDFRAGTVSFWRLFDCKDITPVGWAGDYASIPLRRQASKHLKIPIWLDGTVIQAFMDTGANGLVLDRAAALQAGATQDALAHDPLAGGIGLGGRATGRRHVFHMMLIGKDVYRDVTALITDSSANEPVLVGLPFLLGHRVWFSYGTETLFLQKATNEAAK